MPSNKPKQKLMQKINLFFNYISSEDDFVQNREIFDNKNSKKSNVSLKCYLKKILLTGKMNRKNILFEVNRNNILSSGEKFLLESHSSYYISEILKISNIKEVKAPPKAINALSASETSTGKKRLIADLSISMNIIQ